MKLPRRAFGSRAAYAPGPGFERASPESRGRRGAALASAPKPRVPTLVPVGKTREPPRSYAPAPGASETAVVRYEDVPKPSLAGPATTGGGSRDGMLLGERDATTVSPPRDRDVMARRGRRGASQSREASFDTRENQIPEPARTGARDFFFFFPRRARPKLQVLMTTASTAVTRFSSLATPPLSTAARPVPPSAASRDRLSHRDGGR